MEPYTFGSERLARLVSSCKDEPHLLGSWKNMSTHFSAIPHKWSHRLTVRTPGFHPGNRSSILREITKVKTSPRVAFLLWWIFAENPDSEGVR